MFEDPLYSLTSFSFFNFKTRPRQWRYLRQGDPAIKPMGEFRHGKGLLRR